jgi:hypothetical protein
MAPGATTITTAISISSSANYDQNNFLFHNNGDGTFARVTEGAVVHDRGRSCGCAWADYDNDGDLDLFVANGIDFGGAHLRPNPGFSIGMTAAPTIGSSCAWWALLPTAPRSAPRSGCSPRFGGKSFWQLREISAGRNRLLQPERPARPFRQLLTRPVDADGWPMFRPDVPIGPWAPPNNVAAMDFGIGGRAVDFEHGLGAMDAFTICGWLSSMVDGRQATGSEESRVFRGLLDELEIYQRSLELEEVQAVQRAFARRTMFEPVLTVSVDGAEVVLEWAAAGSFEMQQCTDLGRGVWRNVRGAIETEGFQHTFRVPFNSTIKGCYLRLRGN